MAVNNEEVIIKYFYCQISVLHRDKENKNSTMFAVTKETFFSTIYQRML